MMNRLIIFLLLITCCFCTNAQERHAYEYGINNANGRYATKGFFNSKDFRIKWAIYAYDGEIINPETGLKQQFHNPDELDIICDYRDQIVRGNDMILLKDFHCGKYIIGISQYITEEKGFYGFRGFAELFTNDSKYININRREDD